MRRQQHFEGDLALLDSPEETVQREAGERLLASGEKANHALLDVLATGTPRSRKAAAYLLGRGNGSRDAISALRQALTDTEPKVRKNAAVSLARFKASDAIPALEKAISRETVAWVRASMILAFGQLGGGRSFLDSLESRALIPVENEALRKARDKLSVTVSDLSWRAQARIPQPFLETPVGMERVASWEVQQATGILPIVHGAGLLRVSEPIMPLLVTESLRCVSRWKTRLGGILCDGTSQGVLAAGRSLLDQASLKESLKLPFSWVDPPQVSFRFRFGLHGTRVKKEHFNILLCAVRETLMPLCWQDSPSNYSFEIRFTYDKHSLEGWLIPTFSDDARFCYRVCDVGASINPNMAACLALLARRGSSRHAFDGTCGSGTLLVERAMLDETIALTGRDISRTAVRRTRRNIQEAGFADRVTVAQGDVRTENNWPSCDEVIMNLPFGMRTTHRDSDLPSLYAQIVRNAASKLSAQGVAVFYTSQRKLMADLLHRERLTFPHVETFPCLSGGVSTTAFLCVKRS